MACFLLISCGGDGSSTGTSSGGGPSQSGTASEPRQAEIVGREFTGAEGEVAAVVRNMYAALGNGQGEQACEMQTADLQRRFERFERTAKPQYKGKSCGQIRTLVVKAYPAAVRASFFKIKIKSVKIKGNRATVVHEVPDTDPTHTEPVETEVPLRREGGAWKVNG